jgi:hypothetical protein
MTFVIDLLKVPTYDKNRNVINSLGTRDETVGNI